MSWVISGLGREVALDEGNKIIRIGRDERCNFAFPKDKEGVSRVHAVVTMAGRLSVKLEDKSTYGTAFKGDSLCKTSAVLENGDCFSVQGSEFTVRFMNEEPTATVSRSTKRTSTLVEEKTAKRPKVAVASTQKKLSDFFTRPAPTPCVYAEDTPIEELSKSTQRNNNEQSLVMETIVTMESCDVSPRPSTSKPEDMLGVKAALFGGNVQSSTSLFASRPVLAAETVNESFSLADVNSLMSFNPLANSTLKHGSLFVVPCSPEIVGHSRLEKDVTELQEQDKSDSLLLEISAQESISILQKSKTPKNKSSIFAPNTTPGSSTVSSSRKILEEKRLCSNELFPPPNYTSVPSTQDNTSSERPSDSKAPRTVKKSSIFSNYSRPSDRDIKPVIRHIHDAPSKVSSVQNTSAGIPRPTHRNYESDHSIAVPDVKRSASSCSTINNLKELADMVCTQNMETEDSVPVTEDEKNVHFDKVLKNMEKLVVFADLTRQNFDGSHTSGMSLVSDHNSIAAGKNFKRFRKAKQGKFNPSLVPISAAGNGIEDLVDFRKL